MTRQTKKQKKESEAASPRVSRRGFLQLAGVGAGALLVGHMPPVELPATPASRRRTGSPPVIALAQATDYDYSTVRDHVFAMIEQLGGLEDVVRPGDSVAIKTNLTGGVGWEDNLAVSGVESYATHPTVVRALVEAVQAVGAGEVFIVEAVADLYSFPRWGYRDIADDLGVTLVDLNRNAPYSSFEEQEVGTDWMIYERFLVNRLLQEVDVFMSVAKLKCHATAGVTLSMKNLVGIVPLMFYRADPEHGHRSALHGPDHQGMTRIPSVIADLVRARPIDFALIDGIKTSEGGEGPWNNGWRPRRANVLIAGKNMVATDAVATAVMGFEPQAASFGQTPFDFSLNHLQLATALGLGTNDLAAIEIVGADLDTVQITFRPYRRDAR
ncbi:MAG: DUF362 domain-containing protein [Chloroflexi bacterium]|nr:DUF362 domain-containing protein [Chloroflexota bacterium]